MNHETLVEKYQALVAENKSLKEENERLKVKLCEVLPSGDCEKVIPEASEGRIQPSELLFEISPSEKIKLFIALFKGRDDVYAKRWENKKGDTGYSPVCRNEWRKTVGAKTPDRTYGSGFSKRNSVSQG